MHRPVQSKKCRMIAFANGGKCGSTTLAMLLKHRYPDYKAYDPDSLFEDSPKEVCGADKYTCTAKPFYLDACPRIMTDARMKALHQYDPTAVVVVFVRPQYEALLSLYNDRASSGNHHESSDVWVAKHINDPLFNFTDVYLRALRIFRHVVIVETHDLRDDSNTAKILRKITNARGMPPLLSRSIVSNPSALDGRHTKETISNQTISHVRRHWAETNSFLCKKESLKLCSFSP